MCKRTRLSEGLGYVVFTLGSSDVVFTLGSSEARVKWRECDKTIVVLPSQWRVQNI